MRIVSNTSPIWNIASIDRLDLLKNQFSEVIIPYEVKEELHLESDYPEVEKINNAINLEWIKIKTLNFINLKNSLILDLDQGEAAAIALAIELNIGKILIDESDGRMKAKAVGLTPTGVLGVLLRAKSENIIESMKDEMNKLKHEAGFFISESLFQKVLLYAKE